MEGRRIQILPEHLANKIAAGEVIQRPESVVKELVENSLDAGARSVSVVIKDGGKTLIQVADDGGGMDEQDAVVAFLRHATSKIGSYEDLEAIRTYGFRGEALASIAAVAQVTMKTRRADDDAAIVVQIDGGGEPRLSREARTQGTSITVQNLFFNVPARRKFLKGANTEFRHIYDVMQRAALSRPDVGFKFVSDDDTILDVRPTTLEDRLLDIFGQRLMESVLWIEEENELLRVSGYIGKPAFGQKTRTNQFLFLNRRFIVNRNINHAIYTAYEHLLIKGTFPFFVVFLDIDPHRVDVNVHPSKMEAKFEDEQMLYRFMSALVRKVLSTGMAFPAASVTQPSADSSMGLRFTQRQHAWPGGAGVDTRTGEILPSSADELRRRDGGWFVEKLLGHQHNQDVPSPTSPLALGTRLEGGEVSSSLIWQLHRKYIMLQIDNGVMIVDQHVAHERILYERVLERMNNNSRSSQQVLFPKTLELTPGDFSLVEELTPHLEQLGYQVKPFGRNTVLVEGVPPDIGDGDETKIFADIIGEYKENQQHGQLDRRDNIAKSFACKAAIKAGDPLGETEMRSLVEQLFSTSMPYVCPHGRPIVLKIPLEELDRRFGRT
jgi:DNA mismatch repair protein MutL